MSHSLLVCLIVQTMFFSRCYSAGQNVLFVLDNDGIIIKGFYQWYCDKSGVAEK